MHAFHSFWLKVHRSWIFLFLIFFIHLTTYLVDLFAYDLRVFLLFFFSPPKEFWKKKNQCFDLQLFFPVWPIKTWWFVCVVCFCFVFFTVLVRWNRLHLWKRLQKQLSSQGHLKDSLWTSIVWLQYFLYKCKENDCLLLIYLFERHTWNVNCEVMLVHILKNRKALSIFVSQGNASLTKAWFIQLQIAFNCQVMLTFLRSADNLRRSYILSVTYLTWLIYKNYPAFKSFLWEKYSRCLCNRTNTVKTHEDKTILSRYLSVTNNDAVVTCSWRASAELEKFAGIGLAVTLRSRERETYPLSSFILTSVRWELTSQEINTGLRKSN